MKPFEWVTPKSERQVVEQLIEGKGASVVKAGGVDLVDRMKLGIDAPARLINIGSLPSLRFVRAEPAWLRIGPTTTLTQLTIEPALRPRYLAVAEAAGSAANVQIRNVATVGGNLLQRPRCWYYRNPDFECFKKGGSTCYAHKGENRHHAILGGGPSYIVHPSTMATALSAFDARLRIVGADLDKRPMGREVSLLGDGFFTLPREDYERENTLGPSDLIAEILLPAAGDNVRSAYRSVKERQVFDWPLAEVAVVLTMKGDVIERARVVLGAAAPIPWRAREAEAELVGRRLTPEVAAAAGNASMAGAKPLSHNGYKVPMFVALVERTLLAATGKG